MNVDVTIPLPVQEDRHQSEPDDATDELLAEFDRQSSVGVRYLQELVDEERRVQFNGD